MEMKRKSLLICWLTGIAVLGCSPFQVVDDAMDQATRQVGETIAERVANAYLGDVGPEMIEGYSVGLMQTMFYQGGYHGEQMEYEPGEYTVWTTDDSPYGETIERALIDERDDGWQWWRLEVRGEDPETDEEQHLIMEALFEPADDRRYIREMYVQYPDDEEPTELDITEEDAERWAVRAEEWSEEDADQAFVETVDVEVPAGTFTADRYEVESTDDTDDRNMTTEWWQTDGAVPGNVVQVRQTDESADEVVHTMKLEDHGTGADESMLGAF